MMTTTASLDVDSKTSSAFGSLRGGSGRVTSTSGFGGGAATGNSIIIDRLIMQMFIGGFGASTGGFGGSTATGMFCHSFL